MADKGMPEVGKGGRERVSIGRESDGRQAATENET